MRILAICTTGRSGSLAVFEAGSLLAESRLAAVQRNAQSLAPGIRRLLEQAGWRPADIQVVAVAVGPGSFTGLRVGVTTAKVLAYAVGADCIGVNSLEAIAIQAPTLAPGDARVWVVMDAYRQQVFAAEFIVGPGFSWSGETLLLDDDAWLARLESGSCVTGPALEKLADRLPAGVQMTPRETWEPMARSVGRLAARRHAAGQRDDVWGLSPLYIRPSAAEEKRAQP